MSNADYYQIKSKSRKALNALKEIRKYQRSTDLLISKLSFQRLVREIMFEIVDQNAEFRIQATALEALQKATEIYITDILENKHFL